MFGIFNHLNNTTSSTKITPITVSIEYETKDILVDSDAEKYECNYYSEYSIGNHASALQCKEGHLVCSNCWESHLRTKKDCMICKMPISELSRNRIFENEYSD
ncbi:hypothetical protein DDB_G0278137 [Dictyostelium discoideum AX4]|uniref:RING-type domain-containing protein n=1 Tax=Dictyostelium discoideum TaxID=44689 RepID=Q54YP6_DICDI|nr:hypothetical protein DDB_G0278137 [Dictyostelium discoideum AX4]EAL68241.1 hypothetical protein DDB_G0278137 [Dictyostelium discoideum AX4]|eukprot:XP_642156.1 hypothetical protein DDB_G0278137 [Dictyostelium discoideum AX4]